MCLVENCGVGQLLTGTGSLMIVSFVWSQHEVGTGEVGGEDFYKGNTRVLSLTEHFSRVRVFPQPAL